MLLPGPDVVPVFLLGHLVADERSPLRRWLLYFFARRVEMPLLFLAYHATVGDARFLARWSLTRRVFGRLLGYPIARWVDAGSPAPTAEVLRLIDLQAGAIAVGPCRCRKAHGRCGHRKETDIVIRTGTEAWTGAFPGEYRAIDRAEAARIVGECADAGLFHMVFVHCRLGEAMNEYVVCNCCRDGCSVYLANVHLGQERFPLIPGNFYAEVARERCAACAACVAACPWNARAVRDGIPSVDLPRCFGCGICARACASGATTMRLKDGRLPFRSDLERSVPRDRPDGPAAGYFQGGRRWR